MPKKNLLVVIGLIMVISLVNIGHTMGKMSNENIKRLDLLTRYTTMVREVLKKTARKNGFEIYAGRDTIEHTIAWKYERLVYEKCPPKDIKEKIKEEVKFSSVSPYHSFMLTFRLLNDDLELSIPKNLPDYLYLENDRGQVVKIDHVTELGAKKKGYIYTVNYMNKNSSFGIYFPKELENGEPFITPDTEYINLVIESFSSQLGELSFRYNLPPKYPERPKEMQELLGPEHNKITE